MAISSVDSRKGEVKSSPTCKQWGIIMVKRYINNIAEENGKYYIKFSINGEQKQMLVQGAKSIQDAKIILDTERFKLRQIQGGVLKDERKIKKYTADFLFKNFLKYSNDQEKKSYKKDKYQSEELLKHLKEKGLASDISQIKQKHIEQLKIDLKNTPTKRGKKRLNSTVNKYLACLKTAFNLLVKDEDIDIHNNPCFGVSMFPEDNRRDTYLPEDLKDKFLSLLPEMVRDIVELDLATGLRIGNVIHARKCEFNLYRNEWRIPKEKNKGKKDIQITLKPNALKIVKKYYDKTSDYLFINPRTQEHITTFRKSFATAAKKIGIPDLQPKDIRRTVGTWLYHKGVSLRVIKDVLHHSNVATTERYLGITGSEVDKAYEILDKE